MSDQTNQDPMAAIGARIGLPIAIDFMNERREQVAGIHGDAFLADLVSAVKEDDAEAAWRITETLCPDATFAVAETDDAIRVTYGCRDLNGTLTSHKIFATVTVAGCLVAAACSLRDDLLRYGIDPNPGGPRPI